MTTINSRAEFPAKLYPLFRPARYKVLYGGRGGAKSWGVARALLQMGTQRSLRVLCAREIQRTISDSVHRLLSDQVEAMNLGQFYKVTDKSIKGLNGTVFLFVGLRQQDVHKIKSYEGVDVVWCEEAQTITKRSWDILIPTIRAPSSEIWITFNPELDTDETYQRFVAHPPGDAWVIKIGFRDNPWFPDVLEQERISLKRRDPQDYEHVWEGLPRTVIEGAIYAQEVIKMVENGQIRSVPYDPSLKVHTVWDLGWNDQTSIIFVQQLHSELRVIDYWEDSFRTLAEWVADLQQCRYVWGQDWLPHDGAHHNIQTGASSYSIVRGLGRDAAIVPMISVEEGIRIARLLFPRLYIDESRGGRLVECLKRYRRTVPVTTGEPYRPIHDEYSHGADAFRGLAVIVDRLRNEAYEQPQTTPSGRGAGWMSM